MGDVVIKTKLDRYDSYRDSGEDWIGEIPNHWKVNKLKHIFFEKKRVSNPSLNAGSISFGQVIYKDDEKIPESTKASYQELLSGEFLINPLNLNYDLISLRIGLSHINVVVSTGYIILKNSIRIDRSYFNYLLHRYDVAYMKLLGSGVRQTISFNHIANSLLVNPPLEEQTRIANFLDQKTTQIDKAIAQKERLIELLKERRQIMIHEAVTKGLDKEVKMKDSGVPWIGEIPEGWAKVRMGRLLSKIEQGSSPQLINGKSDYKVLKLSAIKGGNYFKEETKPIHVSNYDSALQIRCDDLLLTRGNTPELVADSCIVKNHIDQNVIFSDLIYRLSCHKDKILNDFMLLVLQSSLLRRQIVASARGSSSSMVKVSHSHIKSWFLFLPSLVEQSSILDFVTRNFEKYDKVVEIQTNQITRLKEYRMTLIDAAVTGKIKV